MTTVPPSLSLTECPGCFEISLGAHCTEPQSVTACDWRKCSNTQCLAQFDLLNSRGWRYDFSRMVQDKHGAAPTMARMIRTAEGGWRDNPLD